MAASIGSMLGEVIDKAQWHQPSEDDPKSIPSEHHKVFAILCGELDQHFREFLRNHKDDN